MQTQFSCRYVLSTYFVPGPFQMLGFSSEHKNPVVELGVGDWVREMIQKWQGNSGCTWSFDNKGSFLEFEKAYLLKAG